MLFGQPNLIPQRDPNAIKDRELRKRAKYLRKCKDALWSRWSTEYIKSLRERHNLKHNRKEMALNPGDVIMIKGEEKNRGLWRIGIVVVEKLIQGRDKVVRGVRLRAGKSYLERPVQHLFPLELSCDMPSKSKENTPWMYMLLNFVQNVKLQKLRENYSKTLQQKNFKTRSTFNENIREY